MARSFLTVSLLTTCALILPWDSLDLATETPSVPVEDLRAFEERVVEVTRQVLPATVAVRVPGSQGSGVIVSEEGIVLTAGHVFSRPGQAARITLHDGRVVRARTLGRNIDMDIGALIITEPGRWPYAEMAPSHSIAIDDFCLATGHPGGFQKDRPPVLRLGRVTRIPRERRLRGQRPERFFHSTCTIISGDSGGPMFDLEGRVIGIHSRIYSKVLENLHVPIHAYHLHWERLLESEEWRGADYSPVPIARGRPQLGAWIEDHTSGARVAQIIPGAPAARAGLREDDIIRALAGRRVNDADHMIAMIGRMQPGDSVELRLDRDGRVMTLDVVLGEAR